MFWEDKCDIKTEFMLAFVKKIVVFICCLGYGYLAAQESLKTAEQIPTIPLDTLNAATKNGKKVTFYGVNKLTFNQAHFDNWISGGESSFTVLLNTDYRLNYSNGKGLVWDSHFLLSIGTTYVSGNTYNRKADDRFEFQSLVGSRLNESWNYSAFLNAKTQLFPGYRYESTDGEETREKISNIFSPLIIELGLGLYLKKETLKVNFAPLTGRVILVNRTFTKDLAAGEKYFGLDADENYKLFFGASVTGFFKTELMKNILLENKFGFYSNYLEKTQNVDVDWSADIRMKVNEKISCNLTLHILYDDDILRRVQFRELFGIGIHWDF